MKALLLALVSSCCLLGGPARLTFTKSFPGSTPAFTYVSVARTGALEYKESPKDDQPLKVQLRASDTEPLFSLAEQLGYFKSPLESGLKVANTGKKTFRYEPENGPATETSFNYSINVTAQQLLDRFEQIAASERAYLELDSTMRYDKLGVNDALADIESLWLRKELAAPEQFLPLFTRIAGHEAFMHLVRDRAARLKDEFQSPPTTASTNSRQK
ncbi:MAG TPA: hypothetical protein VLI55_01195 [Bryobacteraceae bacterium]|nr:hypothetical protein [Bryobacteraceae bacterium]